MRHSIKRISKSALSVILALMMVVSTMAVGIVSTSALTCSGGYLYFDNSIAQWDNVYFVIGHSSYSSVYSMSKISGTNIYYKSLSSWDGATYFSFICTSSAWTSGNWGSSNLSNATYYTTANTSWGSFDSGNTYVAAPSVKQTKNCNANTAYKSAGYSALNFTQSLKAKVSTDGGNTYTESSDAFVNLSISTKKLNGNGTSTTSSVNSKAASVSASAVRSATVNLSYSTPDSDYTFAGWGDSSSTSPSVTDDTTSYTASDSDATYYAYFTKKTESNISVDARYQSFNNDTEALNSVSSTLPDDLGATYTVNDGTDTITVSSDTSVTLSASTSNTDKYTFAGWFTDEACTQLVGTDSDLSHTPTADTTYYALYQQNYKTVTYNVTGADGTINGFPSGTAKIYGVGSEVTVSASDVTGYTSVITVTGATLSDGKFTVGTSDVTVTATYTANSHNVTFATLTNGSFDDSTSKSVAYGTEVTVKVTPDAGYNVDTVKYGSETASVTYNGDVATATFTMPDSDVVVSATFSIKSYTISDNSDNSKGSVQPKVNGTSSSTFSIGDTITFEPTAVDGYEWTSYTVTFADGSSVTVNNGESKSVTIDASKVGNITVTGTFTEKSYNITYVGDNCTKPADTTAKYKSSVAISDFTANDGYVITGYTVTKTGDTSTAVIVTDNSFTMPAYDVTVTATVKKQHTVTVTAGEHGKAYVSSYVTYDNQTKTNTDTTLTSVKVYPGSSVTFTAVPDSGYVVGYWNTSEASGSTTYTVSNVTDETNVSVSFTDTPKYTYALVGASTIKDSNGQAAAWNGGETLDKAAFDAASSLKFTNNKLVVTAEKDNQFRFIGTDGTKYYHYGSNDIYNTTVGYTSTYNTKKDNMLVYKFSEAGTFEIEITSGTDSPMSFKVTKLATYYIAGRFRVKASEDASDYTYTSSNTGTNKWDAKSTVIQFSYAGDGLYKLDTYCTIKELSETISSSDPYFLIYDGTTQYVSNVSNTHDMQNHNESNKVTLKTYSSDNTADYLKFSDTSNTDTSLVTLYLDTTGTNLQLYYVADSGKTALDAPTITSDRTTLTASNSTATITVTPATYPDEVEVEYYLYNGSTYVSKTSGTTFTVSTAGTYTVKAVPVSSDTYKESVASNSVTIADGRTPVTLKAMNGVSTLNDLGTTVAEAANTSSSVTGGTAITDGMKYTVTKGSTVTVTTTMVADVDTAEKFVYAFFVNNKDTYLATEGIATTGDDGKKYATYYANFTIDEDATDTTFTVVPIYYYKACANEGEYIKFYVNTKESTWDTIYNYAYYYDSEGKPNDNTKRSDGVWPGQPMLYDETKQLYYSLVPKTIDSQSVSGLTVNNNGDEQTYDFDDFKYIYESGYDIVRLDLKYKSGHGTASDGHAANYQAIGASYSSSTGFGNPSKTITTSTFDGRWEEFIDINGNPMSLLGKEVTDTTNKLYVVSTALYNISSRGQYMTAWYVYKDAGNGNLEFVTAACPSDFVPRDAYSNQLNTTAYTEIENAGLDKAAVQIVFEDVQFYDNKNRFDGRWYYAQSDSEVSAYAYYRTSDDNGVNYSDLMQDAAYASVDGAVSITNPKLGLDVSVVSSPLAGYIFDHWSVADNSGNIIIDELENVGSSFTTTLDQEMHYVANFYKAATGTLTINHSKYVGTDAKGGLGYYRLEVQVYRNGAWTDVTAGTGTGANGQSVTITLDTDTDKYIRIKLITETAGENTFRYWYTTSSNGTEIIEDPDGDMTWNNTATDSPSGKSGILTYTFDTEVWKLFRDNEQKVSQLNFYSDIAPVSKNYKLTYIYTDRFGNEKSYVVTDTHDDDYYVNNGNSWAPTQELIYEKAPYIDDLYKNCTWTMTNCTIDGTEATLIAVQVNKNYTVEIFDSNGLGEAHSLPINSYVKDNLGKFYVADETNSAGKEFSYWVVYKRNSDGTDGEEVARQYQRKYTLVVLDDYNIRPVYGAELKDEAYISAPQYSREQYTNADGTVITDTLYVDFMLAYVSSEGALLNSDPEGNKYQTGVLVEFGPNYMLEADENGIVADADYSSIKYDTSKETLDLVATKIDNGKYYMYDAGDGTTADKRAIYNFTADNSDFNNMNRLDYFVAFKNTSKNRLYVMKAYYYVIVDGEVIISDPVYFNLYDVGTSDPNTNV